MAARRAAVATVLTHLISHAAPSDLSIVSPILTRRERANHLIDKDQAGRRTSLLSVLSLDTVRTARERAGRAREWVESAEGQTIQIKLNTCD